MNTDGHFNYIEFPVDGAEAVKDSREFFEAVFGWQYKEWGDSYVDTQNSGIVSGVSAVEGDPATPLPVVYSDDLERLRKRVVEAGGHITQDIFSFPGGRRFHFREPSGNELAAWSEAPE